MRESKKEWSKPELLVLVRGEPEEAVLTWCKSNVYLSTFYGPNGTTNVNCSAYNCSYACSAQKHS
jgi:hypothetical protein